MKNMGSWWMMMMVMVWISSVTVTVVVSEELHRVGDARYGWVPDVNFTEWLKNRSIMFILFSMEGVGVYNAYFGFDKRCYSVLQVNQTSYENCIDRDFIFNVTRGGRDVFQLTEAKTYYFISGGGYCFRGMKVAVPVTEHPPPPAEPPLTSKNGTPTSALGVNGGWMVLGIGLGAAFLLLHCR
ncbi:Phytocyanin domain [Dillenia turbinata]|uniref:Phytocyanin domain n=1 Tax=Dillenia turbinata TaxID=194707 RepID=A0AAN8VVN0_9MAGN